MLFDIAWPELLLIGAVALVVIGPKDLPRAMRVAGVWIRKARSLSREFQSSVDQMIREAELEEMRQELKTATDFNIAGELQKAVDPTGELTESIKPPALPDYFEEAPAHPIAAVEPDAELEPELPGLAEPARLEPPPPEADAAATGPVAGAAEPAGDILPPKP